MKFFCKATVPAPGAIRPRPWPPDPGASCRRRTGPAAGGEGPHVLGDALVGVVDFAPLGQAPVRSARQVAVEEALRQPLAPEHAQPLLGVAGEDFDDGGKREHPHPEADEGVKATLLPLLQRGHDVPAGVAVGHVQAVDGQQQRGQNAQAEQGLAPRAELEEGHPHPGQPGPQQVVHEAHDSPPSRSPSERGGPSPRRRSPCSTAKTVPPRIA
jgi:hypothetical protein